MGVFSPREMVLVFRGTHQVMSAEKHLKKGGVAFRLIPVPRRLTSDCGLAIRIPAAEHDRARQVLSAVDLFPVSAHILLKDGLYEDVPF